MFTFGRDHEKKCAIAYVRDPEQAHLILAVVDAVHDLIEGKGSEQRLVESLRSAFSNGGSGIWEKAEAWLRKAAQDYPSVLVLWPELAQHPKAEIRFRVACVLDSLPEEIAGLLGPRLAKDKSKRVASMAAERMEAIQNQQQRKA